MKASVVYYKDLERWDVKYLARIKWCWDKSYIRRIGDVLTRKRVLNSPAQSLPLLSIHFDGSMTERPANNIKGKVFVANGGDLVYSKIDLRNGAIGIVPDKYGKVGFTSEFPIYVVCEALINREYVKLVLHSKNFRMFVDGLVSGTSGRKRVDPDIIESIQIPVPPLIIQQEIVSFWETAQNKATALLEQSLNKEKEISNYLCTSLGISLGDTLSEGPIIIEFKGLDRWDITSVLLAKRLHSNKYPLTTLSRGEKQLSIFIARGKSPEYDRGSTYIVLNQKCNRWNDIDIKYARKVSKDWIKNIDPQLLTKDGDVIINSTGEGTLGRASYISKDFQGLYYDSHMILLRLNTLEINPLYFVEVFNSPFIQKQIDLRKSAKTTKQTELGKENLKDILFPLPPKNKQDEISQAIQTMRQEIENQRQEAKSHIKYAEDQLEALITGKKVI